MWISKVTLQNIKSYGELESVRFTQGVNAICGPNGAGKSTILEAIGFALFDALNYKNQDQFLREGAKQGQIAVTFVDAADDREYEVVRTIGGRPPSVHDPLTKKRIVSGKQDVFDWLNDHLAVSPTTDLSSLFTDAIGIPQGMLAGAFLDRPSARKAKFDPLLQVDEYETVWERLRDTVRFIELSINEKMLEANTLRTLLIKLPELTEQQAELVTQSAQVARDLRSTQEKLASTTEQKSVYEEQVRRVRKLDAEIRQIDERLRGIAQQRTTAQHEFDESVVASGLVHSSRQSYLDFEEASARVSELAQKRIDRDQVLAAINEQQKQLALLDVRIESSEEALEKTHKSRLRIKELEPMVASQIQLERRVLEIELQIGKLEDAKSRHAEELTSLEDLKSKLDNVQVEIAERERITSDLGEAEEIRQSYVDELKRVEDLTSSRSLENEKLLARAETARGEAKELELARQRLSEADEELLALKDKKQQIAESLSLRVQLESELVDLKKSVSKNSLTLGNLQASEDSITDSKEVIEQKIETLLKGDESECPLCQQPLTQEHARDVLNNYTIELDSLTGKLEFTRQQRKDSRQALLSTEQSIEASELKVSQLPSPGRIAEIEKELAAKSEQSAKWEAEVERLGGAHGEVEIVSHQLEKRGEEIGQLKDSRQKIEKERLAAEDRIRDCHQSLSSLARPERARELKMEIEQQELLLGELEKVNQKLSDAPLLLEKLQTELKEMGDPKQEHAGHSALVAEESQLIKVLETAQEKRTELEDKVRAKEIELEQFDGLDPEIASRNQTLESNRSHHEIYLSNIKSAEKRSERRLTVDNLEKEKETEANIRTSVAAKLEEIQTFFDPQKMEEVLSEHASLIALEAEISERHRGIKGQEAQIESDISELLAEKEHLGQVEFQLNELSDLQSTLKFIRKTIREAGPLITRRLIQAISARANRIYGEIMADSTSILVWELDYGITLNHRSKSRDFRQLSGGEQMAAALAIRLALLLEMSGIRIAFFDEPTAHLDDSRRENLAEQIGNIKGFNQLFVISHDDTFERETHHIIRVAKVDGQSHVEIG